MASIGEILLNTLSAGKYFSSFFYPLSHCTLSLSLSLWKHSPLLARLPLDPDAFQDVQLEHNNSSTRLATTTIVHSQANNPARSILPLPVASTTLALPLVIRTRNTLTLLDIVLLFWLMTSLRNVDSAGVSKGIKGTLDLTTTITANHILGLALHLFHQ